MSEHVAGAHPQASHDTDAPEGPQRDTSCSAAGKHRAGAAASEGSIYDGALEAQILVSLSST